MTARSNPVEAQPSLIPVRRISPDMVISELPELHLDRLTTDQLIYLRHMLGLIHTGDMFHGRFVEVHVARLLGADLPDRGVSGWDLRIDGPDPITLEVKAAATGGTYRLNAKSAQVWVFVTFDDKAHGPAEFRYVVAPATKVAAVGTKQISQKKAFTVFGPEVAATELLPAVRAAARANGADTRRTPRRTR